MELYYLVIDGYCTSWLAEDCISPGSPTWMYCRWLSGKPSSRQSPEPRPTKGQSSTIAKRKSALIMANGTLRSLSVPTGALKVSSL